MSHSEPVPSKRAIFLSYASEDAAAVQRIAEALRSAGIEAWLDQDELGVGDTWDMKIRSQIKSCQLFMPVISAATQARTEGYFRREWKLAVERTHDMADYLPFLVPAVIDDTNDVEARVPDKFREVQWTRLPGGETSDAFCARINQLLARKEPISAAPISAGSVPPPPRTGSRSPVRDQAVASPPGAKPDPEAAPPVPDYDLVRRIGRGSYGDVWLARGVTGIYRAVKVVYRDRFQNAEPFEREFRGLRDFAAISLQTKGQMALLHIGWNDALGFFYYVMELADDANPGRAFDPATYVPMTLKEWRRRRGRVPAAEVVTAGVELASALAALHANGLVHRDVKPSNVILVNGQAKLADIGLVTTACEAHTFIGTVGYVPPEGPGSPGADVYALGCVLYELATGLDREEFPRLPPELGHLRDHRLLLALNAVILRACESDPRRRYPAATAVLDDLLALQGGAANRGRPSRRVALAASVLVVLALGLGFWWKSHSGPPVAAVIPAARAVVAAAPAAVAEKSIAVLAFVNLSDDKDNEYFSDGISEELLNDLATVPGLKVMARTSSFFFKDKNVPVSEIARQLKVAFVIEGSVRKSGSRVRVTAELVKAADGFRVWSKSFDRELKDIFALQDELAGVIVGQLRTPLFGLTGSLPATDRAVAQTQNLAAHELFWRGRFEFNKKSPDGLTRSIDLYEQAVKLDPDFALAWAQLATARSWAIYLYGADRATYLPAMQTEAARAAALAPDLADTQVALSEVAMENWEWKAARQSSDNAVALAPSDSDVLQMASFVALACGDDEAVERFARRALDRDPFNVGAFLNLGLARIAAGDFGGAEKIARQTIALAPNMDWGYFNLMEVCLRQNRPDEAAACVPNLNGFRQMIAPALVAQARGRPAEADSELKHLLTETKIPESNPYLIAEVYGFRGEADQAFLWLDRAYAAHSQLFCILLTDNLLQGLHSDPRWHLLLEKLGLSEILK